MNRFLVGFCLGMTLSACEVGITNSPEKIQDDTSETEDEVAHETEEEEPAEDETGLEDTSEDEAEELEEETEAPLTDFSQSGPFSVLASDRTASVTDCSSMSYRVYTPDTSDPPVVILGHGFARGSGVMTGWAEHLASWGVEVLLPTLCHYNIFTGVDHEMNGQNMIDLSEIHGTTDVIYAGHSAGGLAAIIAASLDSNAIGVLGLDATDTQGVPGVEDFIGQNYAGDIFSPAFSIRGEPSTCNSDNNGIDLFRMMDNYQAIKITSADHCDFENPTDAICELGCENSTFIFEDTEIRPAITILGTSAILSLAGISEDATSVWEDYFLEDWMLSGPFI